MSAERDAERVESVGGRPQYRGTPYLLETLYWAVVSFPV